MDKHAVVEAVLSLGHIEHRGELGPTAGVAFNATLLSYLGSLDIGINSDTAAVDDPALLVQCIEESLQELVAAAP